MENVEGITTFSTDSGMLLENAVFLTKQTCDAECSFPATSFAVTRIFMVDPEVSGIIKEIEPEAGRFVPAEIQDSPLSPEYSTFTPAMPVLSVADHETLIDWPGETDVNARGSVMLTDGGKISPVEKIGIGVDVGTIAVLVGVGVKLTVARFPEGVVYAFRQTFVSA